MWDNSRTALAVGETDDFDSIRPRLRMTQLPDTDHGAIEIR
jgi:hypothetical protein